MHHKVPISWRRGPSAHSGQRSEMERIMNVILQFAMIFWMILHLDGKSVMVIVGDRAEFPVDPDSCPMSGTAELYREDGTGNPPRVAARRVGVCTPGDGFTDRLDLNSCFTFSRSLYTDTGLYEIRCGSGRVDHIQLDVVVASESSVNEGEQVTLRCYYKTAGRQVEALRWEKNGVVVLEVNLSTGEIRNGTGFEGKRLSPAGASEGDFSLTWDEAQIQDEGDYFCSVRSQGARMGWGDPAAARLKVNKKHLDPTTPRPPLNQTQRPAGEQKGTCSGTVIAVALSMFVAGGLAGFGLCRWIKSCRPSGPHVSSGPGAEGPSTDVEMSLIKVENPAGSEEDVGPSRVHG